MSLDLTLRFQSLSFKAQCVSLFLMPVDQVVKLSATVIGSCLSASCHNDYGLILSNFKQASS